MSSTRRRAASKTVWAALSGACSPWTTPSGSFRASADREGASDSVSSTTRWWGAAAFLVLLRDKRGVGECGFLPGTLIVEWQSGRVTWSGLASSGCCEANVVLVSAVFSLVYPLTRRQAEQSPWLVRLGLRLWTSL